MIAENLSPTRRLSLQFSLYIFHHAFATKIVTAWSDVVFFNTKKTLVSSNWNPPESFDIAQERPTSERARFNVDVQNRTGVFKIERSCPNTDEGSEIVR